MNTYLQFVQRRQCHRIPDRHLFDLLKIKRSVSVVNVVQVGQTVGDIAVHLISPHVIHKMLQFILREQT